MTINNVVALKNMHSTYLRTFSSCAINRL